MVNMGILDITKMDFSNISSTKFGELATTEFYAQRYWILLVILLCGVGGAKFLKKDQNQLKVRPSNRPSNFPPIVRLTNDQIFNDPINSYNQAIRDHGDIIAVKKKDKLEVMVSEKYVSKVLTDEKNFSFEHGVADAMNMKFLLDATDGKIFKIMAEVTSSLVSKRMDMVVSQVSSIFFSRAKELANSPERESIDLFEYCQSTVSDAMVSLLLGKKFLNPANSNAIRKAAMDIAELGGIFQNRSYFARTFPFLWRIVTAVKVVFWRILIGLFMFLGRSIWAEMSRLVKDPQTYIETEEVTLLLLLVRRFATPQRTLSWDSRKQILLVLTTTMFASVHQVASTMVWVLCEIALRPDYQKELYTEVKDILTDGPENLTHDDLHGAVRLDSFIREVMRTKGDTFSTVRMTMHDTAFDGYLVPKGYTVHPNASLAHNVPDHVPGEVPEVFDGRRWLDKGKPASMAGPGHLAFGLGRWACPGRVFAIAEIKMMIFAVLTNMKVELIGNEYRIVDKLMIASAPPEAYFRLTKREL